jgi:HD-like signal output (HDOD) protein
LNDVSLKELIEQRFATDSNMLPVFNPIAMELLQLKDSNTASAQQIADVILRDQALASRILQVANSAYYGGLSQVGTLSGAVMRLGMNRIASLAMVAAQLQAHAGVSERFVVLMPDLWKHSFACAVGARWLATETGHEAQAEEAFLAGLLHDIGELFLVKVLDNIAAQNGDGQRATMTKALVTEIQTSLHNEIGDRLMREWNLPERYAQVARDHHLDVFDESEWLLAIVRLMDVVCIKMGIGQPADPEILLAAVPEASVLGLQEIQLAQLEVFVEDSIADADAML